MEVRSIINSSIIKVKNSKQRKKDMNNNRTSILTKSHSIQAKMNSQATIAEETASDNFCQILECNKEWAKKCVEQDRHHFKKLTMESKPKVMWIGCSDLQTPANQIMGLRAGEVFVHSNVANVVSPSDINILGAIQYAVEYLGVEDIIVSGHYNCGGIQASFKQQSFGSLQCWLSRVRDIRSKYRDSFFGSKNHKQNTLVELNVRQQAMNVSRIAAVQKAWKIGRVINIHGVVYDLSTGTLKDLGVTFSQLEDVPEQFRLVKLNKKI